MSGAPVETPEAALREAVALKLLSRRDVKSLDELVFSDDRERLRRRADEMIQFIGAALAAPSVAPSQPDEDPISDAALARRLLRAAEFLRFRPLNRDSATEHARSCELASISLAAPLQEPAAPCIGCGGTGFRIDNATGDQVPCECTSMYAAPPAQSAVAPTPTLAEVANAAEHFRYCEFAGGSTEFYCDECTAASNIVRAALESLR